jgi:RNA polymerase sigma factor (sigma-70 family)
MSVDESPVSDTGGFTPRPEHRELFLSMRKKVAELKALCGSLNAPSTQDVTKFLREIPYDAFSQADQARLRERAQGITSIRDRLVTENRGLVFEVVYRYLGSAVSRLGIRNTGAAREEVLEQLTSEGQLGLISAVGGFDPGRENAFSTYAWTAIERRMWRWIKQESERRKHYRTMGQEVRGDEGSNFWAEVPDDRTPDPAEGAALAEAQRLVIGPTTLLQELVAARRKTKPGKISDDTLLTLLSRCGIVSRGSSESVVKVAQELGVSPKAAQQHVRAARLWIIRALRKKASDQERPGDGT